MDYIRFDSGAPVAFPSPGTLSQTTPQPTDTKENVSTRLKRDIQSIIEYPYIQKPLGALSIYDGCKMISDGFLLILTPVPSLQDELIGIAKIFWGFKDVIDGIDDLF